MRSPLFCDSISRKLYEKPLDICTGNMHSEVLHDVSISLEIPGIEKGIMMFRFLRQLVFNKYIWLLFVPLVLGWALLTVRLHTRTNFAMKGQLASVKRIWGGNLEQPMPSIRYKGFVSDVSALNRGELAASEIAVDLRVDYRKKGLVYYTGYNADFSGKYTIRNPEPDKIYLSFIFPYPMQQGEGMLRDVILLVNEQEDAENTEYQPNLALWTGVLEPEASLEMTVRYTGRGLNHFIYGFEPGTQIQNFTMQINVLGTGETDYPVSTMSPTNTEPHAEGTLLTWKLDRTLTQFNIGVLLPDKLNIARQIAVMSQRAPFFYLLFLGSICLLLRLTAQELHFIKIAIISAAYFLFYPLFAYLSVYLDVVPSFAISFGILGFLIFNYARIVYTLPLAVAVVLAYTFYLGVTSLAALLPTYTGLILVIEGVVILAILMQVFSRYRDIKLLDLFGVAPLKSEEEPLADNLNFDDIQEESEEQQEE